MVEDLVGIAGYETACTTAFGVNGHGQDMLAMHRIFPLSLEETFGEIFHRLKRYAKKHVR
jgi:hypothetical protein